MVRASKLPFKNFEYNIQRATALARLDGYLEDISHNEGKRTIGAFLNIPKELMQSFKIDSLMREFEKRLEEHFKAEYDRKGKQHFEDIAKDLARRLKPEIEKISEIFEEEDCKNGECVPNCGQFIDEKILVKSQLRARRFRFFYACMHAKY